MTIAVDSGHLNYRGVENSFQQIGINPEEIKHVFITHADVDHCGGIDTSGTNIYPNAQVYLGRAESAYLNGSIHRMTKLGVKIKNCVRIKEGYYAIDNNEKFDIGGIKVQSIPTPGHTLGHTCYIVDDKILFTGDCLAINEKGGYSFFDFFVKLFLEKSC